MLKMKDSRGNESITLGFVIIAFIIGNIAFVYPLFHGESADLAGYGMFLSGAILPYVAREFIEKKRYRRRRYRTYDGSDDNI